jgi:hypothetical protein
MSIWGNNTGYLVAKCIYIDAERKADVVRQKGSQTDRQTDKWIHIHQNSHRIIL